MTTISLKELNIDSAAILRAIESLRARREEISTFSVAMEMQIPKSILYEDLEILSLIFKNSAELKAQDFLIQELLKQINRLEKTNAQKQKEINILSEKLKNARNDGFLEGVQINYQRPVQKNSVQDSDKRTWALGLLEIDLEQEINAEIVKQAYRKKMSLIHPDVSKTDTSELCTKTNLAYQFLLDYCCA